MAIFNSYVSHYQRVYFPYEDMNQHSETEENPVGYDTRPQSPFFRCTHIRFYNISHDSQNWMMGKFTGNPYQFDGENHGFRLRFSHDIQQISRLWGFPVFLHRRVDLNGLGAIQESSSLSFLFDTTRPSPAERGSRWSRLLPSWSVVSNMFSFP